MADREIDPGSAQLLYKQAGLDFMRVATYFPNGKYRNVCLIETAYVHQKISRPAMAIQICEQVASSIGSLTKRTEPEYLERLDTLRRQLEGGLPQEQE